MFKKLKKIVIFRRERLFLGKKELVWFEEIKVSLSSELFR